VAPSFTVVCSVCTLHNNEATVEKSIFLWQSVFRGLLVTLAMAKVFGLLSYNLATVVEISAKKLKKFKAQSSGSNILADGLNSF
jgi:hypothetical protein